MTNRFTQHTLGMMRLASALLAPLSFSAIVGVQSYAQSVGSGTVTGTVTDPSGAVVSGASVEIRNSITGYQQTTTTAANGVFRFNNVPFNSYRLAATQSGFSPAVREVAIRSTLPVDVKFALPLAGATTTVTVTPA